MSDHQARAFMNNGSGEIKSWTEVLMGLGMPRATYEILVRELALALSSPAPGWSSERPTVPGWYWWKRSGLAPEIVMIMRGDFNDLGPKKCGLYMFGFISDEAGITTGFCFLLTTCGGEWSGPLTPPQEGGAHDRG
jgi:hypothetical protein